MTRPAPLLHVACAMAVVGVAAAGAHPRMWFDAADLPALRARLTVSPIAEMWQRVSGLSGVFSLHR